MYGIVMKREMLIFGLGYSTMEEVVADGTATAELGMVASDQGFNMQRELCRAPFGCDVSRRGKS